MPPASETRTSRIPPSSMTSLATADTGPSAVIWTSSGRTHHVTGAPGRTAPLATASLTDAVSMRPGAITRPACTFGTPSRRATSGDAGWPNTAATGPACKNRPFAMTRISSARNAASEGSWVTKSDASPVSR